MSYHRAALVNESVDGLNIARGKGVYVDLTFGGGGHSRAIMKRIGQEDRLISFDQDKDAAKNIINDNRFELILENFCFLKQHLRYRNISQVDGILADFGISSHQIDHPKRGFSIRFEGPLDMRMNQHGVKSALDVINTYSQEDLKRIFKDYGEFRTATRLANLIVERRLKSPIHTTTQLKSIIQSIIPRKNEFKLLAQIFQAIRIEVNSELENIKKLLVQLTELIKPGGRMSIISYHSLEDRLVKRFIRDGRFEGFAEKDFYGNISVPFKKIGGVIVPSEKEKLENNRIRSAKLRIAEKI